MIDPKIVFTNGCFDLIHSGHLSVLKRCEEIATSAGLVYVGLNSDESVKRLKGENRPIRSQEERKEILEAIRYVDYVIIFDEDTPIDLIKKIKPDVIVKGGDYEPRNVVGVELVGEENIIIVPTVGEKSTTNTIRRIKD